jgi:hypothetical protein
MKTKINKIIEKLQEKYPEWRYGQIIANAVRNIDGRVNCDPFHVQDKDLLESLTQMYGE